jgi:hypothetical protein
MKKGPRGQGVEDSKMIKNKSPFGKGGRRGIFRNISNLLSIKISPNPSLPKRGKEKEIY